MSSKTSKESRSVTIPKLRQAGALPRRMARRHCRRSNRHRTRPAARPPIRPRVEITLECCGLTQLGNLWRSLWNSVSLRFHVTQSKVAPRQFQSSVKPEHSKVRMARRHCRRSNQHRTRPPTRPPIRPRLEAVGWDSVPTELHNHTSASHRSRACARNSSATF